MIRFVACGVLGVLPPLPQVFMSDKKLKALKAEAARNSPAPIYYLAKRDIFVVYEDWTVSFKGMTVTIPAGTETDLASIPRLIWWLMAPHELTIEAAVIHDILYRFRGVLPLDWVVGGVYRIFTRPESDDVLRELAKRYHAARWRKNTAYYTLRAWWGTLDFMGISRWGRGQD